MIHSVPAFCISITVTPIQSSPMKSTRLELSWLELGWVEPFESNILESSRVESSGWHWLQASIPLWRSPSLSLDEWIREASERVKALALARDHDWGGRSFESYHYEWHSEFLYGPHSTHIGATRNWQPPDKRQFRESTCCFVVATCNPRPLVMQICPFALAIFTISLVNLLASIGQASQRVCLLADAVDHENCISTLSAPS